MLEPLPPHYDPKSVDVTIYSSWESKGYFRPQSDTSGKKKNSKPYIIVIPPPNVTGILHMGHALNNTIQDILIRYHRMKGRDTLWVPGVDHAGIATQNVVERKLAKEKKTRYDLGREKFLKEVWKWKEEHGSTITSQLRRLGASCDWSRERFTMDEGLSQAVREAFVILYERGLIYQGNYIINWCPRCQTALSDEESTHKDVQGGLYHIKYKMVPGTAGTGSQNLSRNVPGTVGGIGIDHIVVATTRPETMLGDVAVAVHPEDERYKHLIGTKVILPLLEREIPIIGDEFVDREFGTGFVKVTPAHDPNDFEMGLRHKLTPVNVMHPDGKINDLGGVYKGLDRFEARKKVVADLEAQNLFVKRDSHLHSVGHCYRCDTVVEPYLSKQWFVKMKPLAERALKAHREGKTVFYPDRWTKVYTNWLEGIRDWCISRQIWWGHQIPVWYCNRCRESSALSLENSRPTTHDSRPGVIVSRQTPTQCPSCGNTDLKQDPDVLDTWFSSWLWPFSTLGWPKKTEGLAYFYPTSDLVTAPEIIFFWVARMIMAGLEFMGEVPFSRIYIHGTVRAQSGLKMSKSLGNAINPLEIIEEMGADALRFSMIMLSAQDVYLSREKFEVGRNFTNKLWNASRFVLMNLAAETVPGTAGTDSLNLSLSVSGTIADNLASRWILSRLQEISAQAGKQILEFGLSQASQDLYHFVWNDFCDWTIELAKPALTGTDPDEKKKIQQILFYVLEKILRLLAPFMPFVTEEIWRKLKTYAADGATWPASLMLASWPEADSKFRDDQAEQALAWVQNAVAGIRDLRTRLSIPPAPMLKAVVVSRDNKVRDVMVLFEKEIKRLARLEIFEIHRDFKKRETMIGNSFPDFEVFIHIEGIVDVDKERGRIQKKIEETLRYVDSQEKKLSNDAFVKNAPAEIVEKEREKLADAKKVLKSQEDFLTLFKN